MDAAVVRHFYNKYNQHYTHAMKIKQDLKHVDSFINFKADLDSSIPIFTKIYFDCVNAVNEIIVPVLNDSITLTYELANEFLEDNLEQSELQIPAPLLHNELNKKLLIFFESVNDQDRIIQTQYDIADNLTQLPPIFNNLKLESITKRYNEVITYYKLIIDKIDNYNSLNDVTRKIIINSIYLYFYYKAYFNIENSRYSSVREEHKILKKLNEVETDHNKVKQLYIFLLQNKILILIQYNNFLQKNIKKLYKEYKSIADGEDDKFFLEKYNLFITKNTNAYPALKQELHLLNYIPIVSKYSAKSEIHYNLINKADTLFFSVINSLIISNLTDSEKQYELETLATDYKKLKETNRPMITNEILLQKMWCKLGRLATELRHWDEDVLINYILSVASSHLFFSVVHSGMVSRIAQLIFASMVKHKPEYFVKYGLVKDIETLLKDNNKIKTYVKNSALLHDIGKFTLIDPFGQPFLPFYKPAYDAIKLHTDLGASFLAKIPRLKKYTDIALFHHKFFNDQDGYPEDRVLSNSPVRALVYIITISDCLDAATDNISRFYKPVKPFERVLEEFVSNKSTQFAPEVVDLLTEDEALCTELKDLVTNKRLEIHFQTIKNDD